MPIKSLRQGFVYIVGAGPGDPGLMTVKGCECLKKADVVLYDYLANDDLLSLVPKNAQLIYAGKVGGEHNRAQSQINDLLVQKAVDGNVVVRLKGGDSFIFGRGAEECEALVEAGISYEVVPGITAAVGATCYAGIPLTHRGITTSVAFVTGHEGHGKISSDLDWERLSLGSGTVVIYMGIKSLPQIVENLMLNGRSADTPVALIRWGTRPDQQVLTGTLADIAKKAREVGFKAPAITVVGEVVNMREKLRWFDNRPLFGRSILVTRGADQAAQFSHLLGALGAKVYSCPTIEIEPPKSYAELDEAIKDLSSFKWLIFTSQNAVNYFFERLITLGLDSRALHPVKICAVGSKTTELLKNFGIRADLIPSDYRAQGIVTAFSEIDMTGKRVLFPRGDRASDLIPEKLSEFGAEVIAPVAYVNITPLKIPDQLLFALEDGKLDCATFTSSSTVLNLAKILGENRFLHLMRDVKIASIGPVTSQSCRDLGLEVHMEPTQYTLKALTEEIIRYFQNNPIA